MILSIGMIVKNEEKYLERCLTALKPLLDEVDSELIIADTGSTDGTAEIAKRFTDNVYSFEWVNDFSAARNSTLERAKGEWYMFIDADEILQSCGDIIRFFKSGEYKRYNSATYVQRSYQSMVNGEIDYGSFSDFRVLRLTKRLDGIVFKNPIHEALTPFYDPIKHLDAVADHFGYVFYSDGAVTEEAIAKSKRNLVPMLKIADGLKPGEKPDMSLYKEIADCYLLSEDYDAAIKYLDLGLKTLSRSNAAIVAYFVKKAALLLHLNRFDETVKICEEYFDPKNPARSAKLASDAAMHCYCGEAYYRLSRFDGAIAEWSLFFEAYKEYKDNKINTRDLLYVTVSFSDIQLKTALLCFYESCVKTGRYDAAVKYADPLPEFKWNGDPENVLLYIKLKAEIMKNTDYNNAPTLYDRLDEFGKKQLICLLRWRLFEADANERKSITEKLDIISRDDAKASEAEDICREYFLNGNIDAVKTEKYLRKYQTSFNADILCMMLDKNVDITEFVNAADFLADECAYVVFSSCKNVRSMLENYDTNVISPFGLEKAAELYKFSMAQTVRTKTEIFGLFNKYGSIGLKWQSEFKEKSAPREIQAALMAASVSSAFEKRDHKLCADEAQRFLTAFSEFSPIINAYRQAVKDKNESEADKNQNALSEFEKMAITVKRNIRGMIQAGSLAEAESLLAEYELLCPNDVEVRILREQIGR
ncbi:MAG: glycosyltransferase family 2 protein [Bacteroides sp.]|nr:glycosyltransferase family 2 protein [Bacteroides sp.]